MRLPAASHTARPWRIHALTPDFRLEDVWALPTPSGPDDFPRLVAVLASGGTGRDAPRTVRALLVRPEGRLGALYMAAIRPFRHRLVGPGLLRTIERRWREGPRLRDEFAS